ncbi:hypothetical protein [uncultured Rothia sp.]|jgi:hypothetical protein|nr:hypothetical protein [uncultured Rothia sp.]
MLIIFDSIQGALCTSYRENISAHNNSVEEINATTPLAILPMHAI